MSFSEEEIEGEDELSFSLFDLSSSEFDEL